MVIIFFYSLSFRGELCTISNACATNMVLGINSTPKCHNCGSVTSKSLSSQILLITRAENENLYNLNVTPYAHSPKFHRISGSGRYSEQAFYQCICERAAILSDKLRCGRYTSLYSVYTLICTTLYIKLKARVWVTALTNIHYNRHIISIDKFKVYFCNQQNCWVLVERRQPVHTHSNYPHTVPC